VNIKLGQQLVIRGKIMAHVPVIFGVLLDPGRLLSQESDERGEVDGLVREAIFSISSKYSSK
jgi:hypothetical protein